LGVRTHDLLTQKEKFWFSSCSRSPHWLDWHA